MCYEKIVYNYIKDNYNKILREPSGILKHKFIVPGTGYQQQLWDWDSWLTDVAISQVAIKENTLDALFEYQKGCIEDFADQCDAETGRIPIVITDKFAFPNNSDGIITNCSKPVLIQHALFIAKLHNDYSWLKPLFSVFEKFLGYYEKYCKHESGLYFFIDDSAIGVDNDPCTFYRPEKSSGSIYLNCLMYKELLSMAELAKNLENTFAADEYEQKAKSLAFAINEHCYDERNGFYYSVDLNLLPIDPEKHMHSGCPRHWNTLIQRIDVWSGFLALWAGIANGEQAKRVVNENYLNTLTFNSEYGVRSLAKCEKMYAPKKSGNPSCWLGPIWGASNYFVFRGLLNYGYTELANGIYEKTIRLFGKDIAESGEMHEYYDPETGKGLNNQGFQSWNLLCANMIEWKQNGSFIHEV